MWNHIPSPSKTLDKQTNMVQDYSRYIIYQIIDLTASAEFCYAEVIKQFFGFDF